MFNCFHFWNGLWDHVDYKGFILFIYFFQLYLLIIIFLKKEMLSFTCGNWYSFILFTFEIMIMIVEMGVDWLYLLSYIFQHGNNFHLRKKIIQYEGPILSRIPIKMINMWIFKWDQFLIWKTGERMNKLSYSWLCSETCPVYFGILCGSISIFMETEYSCIICYFHDFECNEWLIISHRKQTSSSGFPAVSGNTEIRTSHCIVHPRSSSFFFFPHFSVCKKLLQMYWWSA